MVQWREINLSGFLDFFWLLLHKWNGVLAQVHRLILWFSRLSIISMVLHTTNGGSIMVRRTIKCPLHQYRFFAPITVLCTINGALHYLWCTALSNVHHSIKVSFQHQKFFRLSMVLRTINAASVALVHYCWFFAPSLVLNFLRSLKQCLKSRLSKINYVPTRFSLILHLSVKSFNTIWLHQKLLTLPK